MPKSAIVPAEFIEKQIILMRGRKVILDVDLAGMYGVPTKRLKEQVRRNKKRFPPDFMLELRGKELEILRSHFATSSSRWGGARYRPFAFTEQGVAMLSSVLTSDRAVAVNIAIMRAFVRLRQLLASNKNLARKLDELEKKYDSQFQIVFKTIRDFMNPPVALRRPIGFQVEDAKTIYSPAGKRGKSHSRR